MRKIKFRCWDKVEKRILYHFNIASYDGVIQDIELPYGLKWEGRVMSENKGEDFILMQYTGLLDRNKKEIYEGDIIQGNEKQPNEVFWSECSWMINQDEVSFDMLSEFNKEMEIIGNIYSNPELIK